MVIVQVETPESIDRLPDLRVPRIDVIFIGPTDLSNSLGHPGDFGHPDMQTGIRPDYRDRREIRQSAGSAGDDDGSDAQNGGQKGRGIS